MDALDELLIDAGVKDRETAHVAGPRDRVRDRAVVIDPAVEEVRKLREELNIIYGEIRDVKIMLQSMGGHPQQYSSLDEAAKYELDKLYAQMNSYQYGPTTFPSSSDVEAILKRNGFLK